MTQPTKEQIAAGAAALREALSLWRLHSAEEVAEAVLQSVLPMAREQLREQPHCGLCGGPGYMLNTADGGETWKRLPCPECAT